MSAKDAVKTQQFASLWIHVERGMNTIKNIQIWNGVVPLSLFSVVNQMWTVCAFLCNTQDLLISNITLSVYAYCVTKSMLLFTFILLEIFFKPVLFLGVIHSTKISGLRFKYFLGVSGSQQVQMLSFHSPHEESFVFFFLIKGDLWPNS